MQIHLSDSAVLTYKGKLDFDLEVGPMVIELSYDGDDIKQGAWTFWNVRIGEDRFGGTNILSAGSEIVGWLESEARDENGHLPPEPEAVS